jgi:hypothetical protein
MHILQPSLSYFSLHLLAYPRTSPVVPLAGSYSALPSTLYPDSMRAAHRALLAVDVVFAFLTTASIGARLVAKRMRRLKFMPDDALLLGALVSCSPSLANRA